MENIKSLSQFKEACSCGKVTFVILEHFIHPKYTGQVRVVQIADKVGIYTTIKDDPNNELSKVNGGKGLRLEYGTEKDWVFNDDGTIRRLAFGFPIMDIKIIKNQKGV